MLAKIRTFFGWEILGSVGVSPARFSRAAEYRGIGGLVEPAKMHYCILHITPIPQHSLYLARRDASAPSRPPVKTSLRLAAKLLHFGL